jgi:hypothetical protein
MVAVVAAAMASDIPHGQPLRSIENGSVRKKNAL